MKRPVFSSHNVLLPDGSETMPGQLPTAESSACVAAMRELDRIFPGDRTGITLADLGSLEGGYAAAFARTGFTVTGFEARVENHKCAAWLPEALGLPNLRFTRQDVRDIRDVQFDVVFCSGLLYHLDQPVSFLKTLGQITRRLLLLNTHVSMPNGHPEEIHHPGSRCDYGDYRNEGRAGHWYHESFSRWDSYGNATSFWLRKDDLVGALIEDAGFEVVKEVHDWRYLGSQRHIQGGAGTDLADRLMFAAVKG